jgi:hypothetical protein
MRVQPINQQAQQLILCNVKMTNGRVKVVKNVFQKNTGAMGSMIAMMVATKIQNTARKQRHLMYPIAIMTNGRVKIKSNAF